MKKDRLGGAHESVAVREHAERFSRNENRDFHERYRNRVKGEPFFSMFKREMDGYLKSRGRYVRRQNNAVDPCAAWRNELLCKLVITNLRTTVRVEAETGERINYMLPNRRFPKAADPIDGKANAA